MRKTKEYKTDQKLTVDLAGLQALLGVGRKTAEEIGQGAEAVLTVGRRRLFYVPKIEEYISNLTEQA